VLVWPTLATYPIFPQGTIESQECVRHALGRFAYEQLGIPRSGIRLREARALGEYVNILPPERSLSRKYMICVVAAHKMNELWLNGTNPKYSKYLMVDSGAAFLAQLGELRRLRPVKFQAMCEMVNKAHKLGMLEWSCRGLLEQAA